MNTFEAYSKRPVKFLEQITSRNWRVKVYGISAKPEPLPTSLINAGKKTALTYLPEPAISNHRYGVGFLIIHQGILRNWFLLDWWEHEDILSHRLFSSPLDDPTNITLEKNSSVLACVHELRVINFESEVWVKTILSGESKPDFDKYLKLRFNLDE